MKGIPKGITLSTPRKIRTLAEQIGHLFRPEKIVLFGSYAYGQPTQESDINLLVIMKTRLRPIEQAVAIRQAVDCPFSMDLLVRTPAQVEERLRLGDHFLRDILLRGGVLYEAAHS